MHPPRKGISLVETPLKNTIKSKLSTNNEEAFSSRNTQKKNFLSPQRDN